MSHEARLARLGIALPGPFPPHEPLVGCIQCNGVARTSGALPRDADGRIPLTGLLGRDVPTTAGVDSARLAALNALSLLRAGIGSLDALVRVLSMTVYVACTPDFAEIPTVADGASRVLVELLGDAGRHTRTAVGVVGLPRDAPVEVELWAAVHGS